MEQENKGYWNPYVAGAVTGIIFILSLWVSGNYFGASTSFVRNAGLIEKIFSPARVEKMDYFIKTSPKIDWQWMFVIGILIGSLISSLYSKTFKIQLVPEMWESKFGSNFWKRAATAFIGGIIALFGARLAGGCPSGHGLSGLIQMAISGYLALISFFIGGMIVARLLYGGGDDK